VRREAGRHLRGERQAVVLSLALSLHFGKSLFFSPTHQAFPRFSLSLSLCLSVSLSLLSFDDRDGVTTCEAPIWVSLCIQGLPGCGELV